MTEQQEAALRQGIEALELALRCHGVMLLSDPPKDAWKYHGVEAEANKAITALRRALEQQPAEEPVAWQDTQEKCRIETVPAQGGLLPTMREGKDFTISRPQPAAQPCPTCVALARTVMMDQTGRDA